MSATGERVKVEGKTQILGTGRSDARSEHASVESHRVSQVCATRAWLVTAWCSTLRKMEDQVVHRTKRLGKRDFSSDATASGSWRVKITPQAHTDLETM